MRQSTKRLDHHIKVFNEHMRAKWESTLHCLSFELWCDIPRCWSLGRLFVRVLPGREVYWLGGHLWCWIDVEGGVDQNIDLYLPE